MDIFSKYYLSNDEVNNMLNHCVVVFDTSALLDLYYYSSTSRQKIFSDVFGFLSKRLWIPAQVYYEFLKNKGTVSAKPIQAYNQLIDNDSKHSDGGHVKIIRDTANTFGAAELAKIKNQIKTLIEKTSSSDKHPFIPKDNYDSINHAVEKIEKDVCDFKESTEQFVTLMKDTVERSVSSLGQDASDDVQTEIERCFIIGAEFDFNQMMRIAKEGAYRYQEQIPPGYKDGKEKIGLQKYGDLFVWKQIIDFAKTKKKDILLITNDVKEDWFDKEQSAPRFELLKEFRTTTSKTFWSCDMKTFLYYINSLLDKDRKIPDAVFFETITLQEQRVEEENSYYIDLINSWTVEWCGVQVIRSMPTSDTWRLFENTKVFEGIMEDSTKTIVVLSFPSSANYARVLHSMQSGFEIKKYYESKKCTYLYYQFALFPSQELAEQAIDQLEKPNIRKLFNRTEVTSYIGYKDNQCISILDANCPLG